MGSGSDARPTLFFDRSAGTIIPRTLERLRVPVGIQRHNANFEPAAPDDVWLPVVGNKGWTVLGFDYSYHINSAELAAIRKYHIGVFYLWGAEAPTWERMFLFARAMSASSKR